MERKPFLLRLDPATMAALRAWASDDLRSLNGQMEFLLRRALREAGRLPSAPRGYGEDATPAGNGDDPGAAADASDDGDAAVVPAMTRRGDRSAQDA
ncbi:MAG: hypothetical protein ACP5VP_00930 [Candidatus Limnocylindrales bacterium]